MWGLRDVYKRQHQEGDRCLIAIAGCISEVAGAHGGFCARYGGDEFVAVSYTHLDVYKRQPPDRSPLFPAG